MGNKTIDFIVEGFDKAKSVMIVTTKEAEICQVRRIRSSSTTVGRRVKRSNRMAQIPKVPRRYPTPALTVRKSSEIEPPTTGLMLPAANLALFIIRLSLFAPRIVCAESMAIKSIIKKASTVV